MQITFPSEQIKGHFKKMISQPTYHRMQPLNLETTSLRGSLEKAGWYRGCSSPGGQRPGGAYPETERERQQCH